MSSLAAAYRVTERLWWQMSPRRILGLIAILTLVRMVAAANAGLLWDEPYYWMWAQRLAAGYYDHPPMVAWWIALSTLAAGDGALGIRLIFVLNIVAVSFAAYGIGRTLFGERIGWLSALWVNVTPLIGIAGFMATPDGPSTLFWTLAVFAFARLATTERGPWWLAVGAFAGLGLLSKYTNLFLGLGIVLALALDPRLRRWFASPWLWAGGIVAVAIFLPVVLWNASHDWISFRFQFGRLGEATFTPVFLLTLLVVQPLLFNPLAAVFVGRGVHLWWRGGDDDGVRALRLLLLTALPAVVFILFQATHGEVLQHWLAPVFPALTVAAVAAASTIAEERQWLVRRIRTDVVPFGLMAMVVVYIYALTPLDRFYPGADPLNAVRGWPAYAATIEAKRAEAGAAWIGTAGYDLTAELTYELRGVVPVVPVTERIRYGFLTAPGPALLAEPGLLVVPERTKDAVAGCFGQMTDLGTAERRAAGNVLATSRLVRVEGVPDDLLARGCERP